MELNSLFSAVTGGGLVLILAQFIFVRLIHQVDRLADKITKIEIQIARITEQIDRLDHIETQVDTSNMRIVRLETLAHTKNGGS